MSSPIDSFWRSPMDSLFPSHYGGFGQYPIFRSTPRPRQVRPLYSDFQSMFTAPHIFGNRVIVDTPRTRSGPRIYGHPLFPTGEAGFGGSFNADLPGPGDLPPFHGGPFATPMPGGCAGLSSTVDMGIGRPAWGSRGTFANVVPDPSSGDMEAFDFWTRWWVQNGDCLWWILSNGDLPDPNPVGGPRFVPPNDFYFRDLYRRMMHCRPPPLDGPYPCLYPSMPVQERIEFSYDANFSEACINAGLTREVFEDGINAAYNLLRQNIDILKWLGCVLEPGLGACFEKVWQGFVHLHVFATAPSPDPSGATYGGRTCHRSDLDCTDDLFVVEINVENTCGSYLPLMTSDARGPAAVSRDCALVGIAGLLLHESCHYCALPQGQNMEGGVRFDVHGTEKQGHCSMAWMIKSAFEWAMAKRYPWITGAGGCSGHDDPGTLFRS